MFYPFLVLIGSFGSATSFLHFSPTYKSSIILKNFVDKAIKTVTQLQRRRNPSQQLLTLQFLKDNQSTALSLSLQLQ